VEVAVQRLDILLDEAARVVRDAACKVPHNKDPLAVLLGREPLWLADVARLPVVAEDLERKVVG